MNIKTLRRILSTSAALYIGRDFIDVAKAEKSGRGLRVTYIKRFRISGQPLQEIDAILDEAFKEEVPHRIAINSSNKSFALRHFSTDAASESAFRKSIVFEAQKYIYFPITEDVVYQFKMLGHKQGQRQVLFFADDFRETASLIDHFMGKKIVPSVIEPMPVLMARMLTVEESLLKDRAYISIHFEPAGMVTITGIWKNLPYLFNDIKVDCLEMAESGEYAGYMTLKQSFPQIEHGLLRFLEYMKKETDREVGQIFISGFLPSDKEEAEISKMLGVQVQRFYPSLFQGLPGKCDDRYMPVLGLLHDALATPLVNFSPVKVRYRDLNAFKPDIVAVAAVSAIIIAGHLLFVGINTYRAAAYAAGSKENFAFDGADSLQGFMKYRDSLAKKIVDIKGIVENRVIMSDVLSELTKVVVPGTWINTFEFKKTQSDNQPGHIFLSGGAYVSGGGEADSINTVVENIKRNPVILGGFKSVELTSLKKKQQDDLQITEFEIRIR